jgi:hypothetical protein
MEKKKLSPTILIIFAANQNLPYMEISIYGNGKNFQTNFFFLTEIQLFTLIQLVTIQKKIYTTGYVH